MVNQLNYEERIIKEIKKLPVGAFPGLYRLIALIREDFISKEIDSEILDVGVNHTRTRTLLSSSKRNWAQEIAADREDRI